MSAEATRASLRAHARILGDRIRRYGWGLVAPASTLVAVFAANVIASRRLGPAGFGHFAVASSIITILSVLCAFGVPTTLVTVLGRQGDAERPWEGALRESGLDEASVADCRAAAVATVWFSALTIGALIVAVEAIVGDRVAPWFPPGTAWAIALASLGTALLEVSLAESQRVLEFRSYFLRMVGGAVVRLVGVAVGVSGSSPTASSALFGYAIAAFGWGALMGARPTALAFRALRDDLGRVRRHAAVLFERSAPVLGSTIVVVATGWLDTIILAGHMAAADVGIYAAAVRLTIAPSTLIGGISALALPVAVSAWREGRVTAYNRMVLLAGSMLGVVVCGTLALASGLIVEVTYGKAFVEAGPVFMALALGYLASFPGNPMSQVLFAAGRTRVFVVVQSLQLAATLAGLAFLVGWKGPLEIAVMRAIVNVLGTVTIMWFAMRIGRAGAVPAARL